MISTRSEPIQLTVRPCDYCQSLFTPATQGQRFCAAKCRAAFHREHGTVGVLKSNRQLKHGSSLVLHLPEVINAPPGTRFRLVREG